MILVAYWHGLRASEVVAIKRIDVQDGFLTVQRLKGSMKTTQALVRSSDPLLDEATGFEKALIGLHNQSRVFPLTRERFWQIVQQHGKAAGIPKHLRHPHVCKHSIAMQTIEKAGIHNVRQRLGHRSIASTGEYLKTSDLEASKAIEKAAE